ncbi:MAG: Polysaccharide export protein [Verrucomicrobiales bacterium]|nr:Polysaccharide export protein [Verrucomicrobiales bacterium]
MKFFKTISLICIAGLAAGAASKDAATSPLVTNDVATLSSSVSGQTLHHMDKLSFRVIEDPNTSGSKPEEVGISAQLELEVHVALGYPYPTIVVNVANKTLTQVREELKMKLEAEYYKQATIDLKLKQQSARESHVLFFGQGARGNALTIPAGESCTIFEGVYRVGVGEFANIHKVKLYRKVKDSNKVEVTTFDMDEIRSKHPEKDEVLQDGDRVEIPERKAIW